MRTVFGAELSLSNTARTEDPDPPGPHLLVLARGPEGYRRLSRQLAAAHLAGGEKGKPRYDYDALTEAAGGHWHILTGCRKGHVRQALSAGGPEAAAEALADLVDRFGRDRVSVELTHHGDPFDDERNAALAALAPRFGLAVVATTAAHVAEPGRGRLAMAMGAIRARQVAGRSRRLAGPARRIAPAVRGRDGPAVRPIPRSGHRRSRSRRAVCLRAGADRPAAAAVRRSRRPHRGQLAARADHARRRPALRPARRRAGGLRPDRAGARRHQQAELPGLFPGGARHHPVLPAQQHPVPGPGVGGQLGGLLRAGGHRRRPGRQRVCSSNGSCPRPETGHPTSTSTSNPTCARRPSSTSTNATAATTPRRSPTSSPTAGAARCATWPAPWASPRASRTPGASRSAAGTGWPTHPTSRTSPSR